MPSTWIEMTKPMTSRCAPPCSMWSGVMIITVTIAACAQAIATTAAPTAGTSRTTSTKRPHDRPRGSGPTVGARPRRSPAPASSGSGRSRHHTQPGGDDEHHRADGEAARELGDARSTRATVPPDADEVGAGDGADRGRPHDDRERPGPVLLGREVGRGVARPAVDRGGRAQEQRAEEQHEHRVDDAGDDREHGTGGPDQVAGDQADASPAPAHHPRQPVRRRGRAEHLEGLREAGHRLAAGDVAGQQRGGRDARS